MEQKDKNKKIVKDIIDKWTDDQGLFITRNFDTIESGEEIRLGIKFKYERSKENLLHSNFLILKLNATTIEKEVKQWVLIQNDVFTEKLKKEILNNWKTRDNCNSDPKINESIDVAILKSSYSGETSAELELNQSIVILSGKYDGRDIVFDIDYNLSTYHDLFMAWRYCNS